MYNDAPNYLLNKKSQQALSHLDTRLSISKKRKSETYHTHTSPQTPGIPNFTAPSFPPQRHQYSYHAAPAPSHSKA